MCVQGKRGVKKRGSREGTMNEEMEEGEGKGGGTMNEERGEGEGGGGGGKRKVEIGETIKRETGKQSKGGRTKGKKNVSSSERSPTTFPAVVTLVLSLCQQKKIIKREKKRRVFFKVF
jgi:hypothetical protein